MQPSGRCLLLVLFVLAWCHLPTRRIVASHYEQRSDVVRHRPVPPVEAADGRALWAHRRRAMPRPWPRARGPPRPRAQCADRPAMRGPAPVPGPRNLPVRPGACALAPPRTPPAPATSSHRTDGNVGHVRVPSGPDSTWPERRVTAFALTDRLPRPGPACRRYGPNGREGSAEVTTPARSDAGLVPGSREEPARRRGCEIGPAPVIVCFDQVRQP